MPKLGVNIDHIATVRQVRLADEPDLICAASLAESAGCDSIVVHLREDRRHIQDRDVEMLRRTARTRLNLEMSVNEDIVNIARRIRPDQSTLVPEKRLELTTEGGLDVKKNFANIKRAVKRLADKNIDVSLFIDPDPSQIEASKMAGASIIELHTGNYANARAEYDVREELERLNEAVHFGVRLGLTVNAGHGLTYRNVVPVARLAGLEELNIGHSIISRAVMVGIFRAVQEMKGLIQY